MNRVLWVRLCEDDEVSVGDVVRPAGSEVTGWVVRANSERALIQQPADPSSGADFWRDWFEIARLEARVPACNGGQADTPCRAALAKLDALASASWTGTITCPVCGGQWDGAYRAADAGAFAWRLVCRGVLVECVECGAPLTTNEVYHDGDDVLCAACACDAADA
jgi:hypothetical protein